MAEKGGGGWGEREEPLIKYSDSGIATNFP